MMTPRGLSNAIAAVIAGAIASTAGCYESHGVFDAGPIPDVPGLDAPGRDAPGRDAPGRDAPRIPDAPARRDAPVRDVPARDVPSAGGACQRDRDCVDAFCVLDTAMPARDLAAVPLICGGAGFTAPGSECESNAECENGLCALAGGCVEPCVTDSDCRAGERCTDVPIVTSDTTIQGARACARWVDVPASVEVTNEDVTVRAFRSERFTTPASTHPRRLILNLAPQTDPGRTIDRVALSDGRVLFDITSFDAPINPAAAFFDLAPVLIPNAPWAASLDRRAGITYDLTTGSETRLHRVVLAHEGNGNTLDLNVYFVGIRPTASNRRALNSMLDAYADILSTYDVALGRTRQFEIVGANGANLAVIDSEEEVSELLRFSAGAARPAVNVFLISSSSTFLGISGGIPGAMGVHGTGASGVVLSFDDLVSALDAGFGPEFLGVVIAHEIGHFSGLFHSTEADGSSFDPFPDTITCDASRDTNGDMMITADECIGAGGDNIMFWGPTLPRSTFSAGQRDIIGAAPVLLP